MTCINKPANQARRKVQAHTVARDHNGSIILYIYKKKKIMMKPHKCKNLLNSHSVLHVALPRKSDIVLNEQFIRKV